MLSKTDVIAIKRAVRKLVAAEIEAVNKGGVDPIYHDDIAKDLKSAKGVFGSLLYRLENKAPTKD